MSNIVPFAKSRTSTTEKTGGATGAVARKLAFLASLRRSNLSHRAKTAGHCLIERVHSAKGYAFPSYETLTKDMGEAWPSARRSTIRAVEELIEAGWFTRQSTRNGNRNDTNRYRPVWEKAAGLKVPPVTPSDDLRVSDLSVEGDKPDRLRVSPVTPKSIEMNPVREPIEGGIAREAADAEQVKAPNGSGVARHLPDDWLPSDEMFAKIKSKYGHLEWLTDAMLERFNAKFLRRNRASDAKYRDWDLRWMDWMIDDIQKEYEKRQRGFSSHFAGTGRRREPGV